MQWDGSDRWPGVIRVATTLGELYFADIEVHLTDWPGHGRMPARLAPLRGRTGVPGMIDPQSITATDIHQALRAIGAPALDIVPA